MKRSKWQVAQEEETHHHRQYDPGGGFGPALYPRGPVGEHIPDLRDIPGKQQYQDGYKKQVVAAGIEEVSVQQIGKGALAATGGTIKAGKRMQGAAGEMRIPVGGIKKIQQPRCGSCCKNDDDPEISKEQGPFFSRSACC